MKVLRNALALIVLGFTIALILAGCGAKTVEVTVPVEVEVTRLVEIEATRIVEVVATPEPGVEVPFEELWASSAHADAEDKPFRHWDEDDPPVVPESCARCHTPQGYLDYIGADGSEAGVVDQDYPPSNGITCVACHNDVTLNMTSVVMPSGVEIKGLGDEARCMVCHQGRESTVSVNAAIEEAGVEADVVSENLGFKNIHYFAAAATKYGTVSKGGYEYEGKSYDALFAHVDGFTTCIGCHDSHTLEIKIDQCSDCHEVETVEDLKNVRMNGSLVDFDGDGDLKEGIYYEIEGVRDVLYQAIQTYAAKTAGTPIVYEPESYPYFFIDTDGDGAVTEGEAAYPNKYASWTPRLLKAAYNYQVSIKDPGAFAHGGKYIIELLYDSIEDLDPSLVAGLTRVDRGHFAGSEEPFRHFDEDGEVRASCSRCHSSAGLPLYLQEGVAITQPTTNGFQCSTCHNDLEEWTRFEAPSVTFPSGLTVDSGDNDMNLCMTCHQGRESKISVDKLTAGLDPDAVSDSLRFLNIHYFAAGTTRYGTEAKGGYEYDGKEYVGLNEHIPKADQCVECHDAHELEVATDLCADCHEPSDPRAIRESDIDFDGDGNTTEGLAGEIDTLRQALYDAILAYSAQTEGVEAIVYSPSSYPYFFIDSNANGVTDPGEAIYPNKYASWTPRLLKAAYNYQYATKDPGGFAHNGKYIIQLLYDSIQDLGGDVSGLTRP